MTPGERFLQHLAAHPRAAVIITDSTVGIDITDSTYAALDLMAWLQPNPDDRERCTAVAPNGMRCRRYEHGYDRLAANEEPMAVHVTDPAESTDTHIFSAWYERKPS